MLKFVAWSIDFYILSKHLYLYYMYIKRYFIQLFFIIFESRFFFIIVYNGLFKIHLQRRGGGEERLENYIRNKKPNIIKNIRNIIWYIKIFNIFLFFLIDIVDIYIKLNINENIFKAEELSILFSFFLSFIKNQYYIINIILYCI